MPARRQPLTGLAGTMDKNGGALAARAGNHVAAGCRVRAGYLAPATIMPRLLRHQIGARCPIWIVNSLPLPSTVVGPLL